MKVNIYPDYPALSQATANVIATYIQEKSNAVVCLASGHTPIGVFDVLVRMVKANELSIRDCIFVSLDEWIGIPAEHKGSCRQMMDEYFFDPLNIPDQQIIFFNGMAENPENEAAMMNDFITKHGGLDIMLVGIGTNAHIAMNEPGTPFDITAHVSTLAEETITVGQKYFDGATPISKGVTLGLKHFQDAKVPILMASGRKKSSIIKKVLTNKAHENIPASIIHQIDHAWVMLDKEASSEISLPANP